LQKAVTSVIVERSSVDEFRVGVAEMNGKRPSMEDAHVIHSQANWGFFCVLDGHSGSECSTFIAKRLYEELEKSSKPPEDDEALKALALRLDEEFLSSGQSSGSTATFAIVTVPAEAGGRYQLRIGNIGDSRVLLARSDGTLVEGQGTDGGLTTDHKPNYKGELERINRTGGTVTTIQGVARVLGELAVSRAFGDARFKETGGPGLDERPVTANPELVTLECDPTDFLVLVCDGISEGEFPNREVVRCAAEVLKSSSNGGKVDPGAAAAAVCRKALACNSSDNLSCMIVLLGGGEVAGPHKEFIPGSVDGIRLEEYRTTYANFADRANISLAEAVEMRYGLVKELLANGGIDESSTPEELRREFAAFQGEPPEDEAERRAWFEAWLAQQQNSQHDHDEDSWMAEGSGSSPCSTGSMPGRIGPVVVVGVEQLREAVEASAPLQWEDNLAVYAGKSGVVIEVNEQDGTSLVKFPSSREWLPNAALR